MAVAFAKRPLSPDLTRPHALAGLRRRDGTIDWSPWYLTEEEDMGQSGEQSEIIDVLKSSLQVLAEERGWSSILVQSDNFFAWVKGEPYVQVSPDIYVLDNAPPSEAPLPRRWEVWRPGQTPPRFAVEIISGDWKKDYELNPARYDHLGVGELLLADQEACVRDLSAKGRAPFLLYRRTAEDRLELIYRGQGPVFCTEIGAYLCFQWSSPGRPRVRISRDPEGEDIVPTDKEDAAHAKVRAAAAEEEVAAVKAQAAVAEDRAAAAEDRAATAEEEVAAVKAQTAVAEDRAAAAEDRAAAAEEEVAAVKAQAVVAEDRAAAAEEEVAAVKAQAVVAEDRAAVAEEEIAAVRAQAVVAEDRAAAAEQEIAAAEDRAAAAADRATTAEEEVAAAKAQAALQAKEIAMLRARLRARGGA